ncbi:biotin/lipoyl-containing protein, partial [Vreelandella nigrificans]|uniref:biotin/lipoyl-containing protein n=1 Tax=Vreelandella nigrificans TaxID=2042704 RepID=UPI001AD7EA85
IAGGGDAAEEAAPAQEAQSTPTSEPEEAAAETEEETGSGEPERKEIRVPDLSGSADVPIIEIGVAVGDEVNEEDPLITLESDKASMDVPSPYKGKLLELTVKEGDSVSEGDVIGYIEVAASGGAKKAAPKKAAPEKAQPASKPAASPSGTPSPEAQMAAHKPRDGKLVHAGPAVRMLARELGVDLGLVKPSGPKERVLKEDVHAYVKQAIANQGKAQAAAPAATGSAGIPAVPEVDFSQFGEVEEKPMGRL